MMHHTAALSSRTHKARRRSRRRTKLARLWVIKEEDEAGPSMIMLSPTKKKKSLRWIEIESFMELWNHVDGKDDDDE